jgi:predicted nucleotidyltransferase
MKPPEPATRAFLAQHRDAIHRLARKHGASNVRAFGSVARGEADAQSDIDLLVTVEPGRTMLDIIRFQLDLEDLLGARVDVVEDNALHPLIRRAVLDEAVAV